MKQIRINTLLNADKSSLLTRERRYRIFLGNGITVYFTNKKHAAAYIAETNRFLTRLASELNYLYIKIWSSYRHNYFTIFHVFNKDFKIKSSIESIEKSFNMIATRSSWTNGNYFTFKWFTGIIEELQEMNDKIIKLIKEARISYLTDEYNINKQMIDLLKNKLENYGRELQENTPNCFYDHNHKRLSLSQTDDK